MFGYVKGKAFYIGSCQKVYLFFRPTMRVPNLIFRTSAKISTYRKRIKHYGGFKSFSARLDKALSIRQWNYDKLCITFRKYEPISFVVLNSFDRTAIYNINRVITPYRLRVENLFIFLYSLHWKQCHWVNECWMGFN